MSTCLTIMLLRLVGYVLWCEHFSVGIQEEFCAQFPTKSRPKIFRVIETAPYKRSHDYVG